MTEPIIELIELCALALFGGATLVQIAPIKINPWTWLARKVGRAINGEVIAKVDKLEKDMGAMRQAAEERAAKDARIRILRFGDEILHDKKHTKEHFDQILLDITEYSQYCKDHPEFLNNMTELTSKRIMDAYYHLLETNGFL